MATDRREYLRAHYANNKASYRARTKRWFAENPDKRRGYSRRDWAPGEHERAEAALPLVVECACCGAPEPMHARGWQADHDHLTGLFRAHVCAPCNRAIGQYEARGELVAAYLRKYGKAD